MDWTSPDKRIVKLVLEKGTEDKKPSLFSECRIAITSDNLDLLKFNERQIIVGDNCDTHFGRLLDIALQFMSPLEVAKITFNDLELGNESFRLELQTCDHKGYIFEWDGDKKLKHAALQKEKGVHLFRNGIFLAAANRFSLALKLLHSIPVDVSNVSESVDNVPLYDINSMKVKLFDNLAACESKISQNNVDKATHLCKKALELNENDIKALNRLGSICQCQGDIDSAIEYYSRIATVEPSNMFARQKLNELALINDKQKNNVADIYKKMFPNML